MQTPSLCLLNPQVWPVKELTVLMFSPCFSFTPGPSHGTPEPGTFNQMSPSEPSYHKVQAYRPLWESITHKDVGKFAQRGFSCEKRRHVLTIFTALMFTVYVYLSLPPFIQNLISAAL